MNILIAPNAFKNSLTAIQVAEAIEKGLKYSKLSCTCECFPIADGGDGTGELIIQKYSGTIVPVQVHDPLARKIKTSFGLINEGNTAVIEMANASGIRLLSKDELNPIKASSFGTGEIIKHALDAGVSEIIIGMGGSATVDGATGILKALGVRFLDSNGNELTETGDLIFLDKVDTSGIDARVFICAITVLCDVDNRLLGAKGAAAVFGPQKGATPEDVLKLEEILSRLRDIVLKETGKDMGTIEYGGAAGGAAASLYAFLNAKLVNGADYFLMLTQFEKNLQRTDLVITGEGCVDEQTLQGKGPFAVAYRAKQKNIPVIALAGKVPREISQPLKEYFNALIAIGNEPSDIATAMKFSTDNLIRASMEIGDLLALTK